MQIKRSMQLPKLSAPPPDFLASMEQYIAEAPRPLPADGSAPAAQPKVCLLRLLVCCLGQSLNTRRKDDKGTG